ncbi:MAG: hypothetical protein EZS28_049840, partial [Streblomastix strix]
LSFATSLEEVPIYFFAQLPSMRLQYATVSRLIYRLCGMTSISLTIAEATS